MIKFNKSRRLKKAPCLRKGRTGHGDRLCFTLDRIKEKIPDQEPFDVFNQAVENVKPHIEVRSRRVGGAAYQVPMQVNKARQQSLAFRWLLAAVRDKKGRPTAEKLSDELMAAYRKEGAAISKGGIPVWLGITRTHK